MVPVGGGGLIGGIATGSKSDEAGDTCVIGVQTELYSRHGRALGQNKATAVSGRPLRSPKASPSRSRACITLRNRAGLMVEDGMLVGAQPAPSRTLVILLLEIEKTLTEGAGAAGVAAIRSRPELFKGRKVGCVLCGGNIDLQLLVSVLHRSLARRLVRLTVTTLDAAGQLADIASIIAKHGGNIVEVWHDRIFASPFAKTTAIDIEFELQNPDARQKIEAEIALKGMGVVRR